MIRGRRLVVAGSVLAMLTGGGAGVAGAAPGSGAGSGSGSGVVAPNASAACHVTDGKFTTCSDGRQEWADVAPAQFTSSGAFLYSDEADLDPALGMPGSPVDTLMLMYDECRTTVPLGPDEYFLVSFDTVDGGQGTPESIERYNIHVFTDGTIVFLENGKPQVDGSGRVRSPQIEGQRGRASFGASPRCPTNHLVVEYQIPLSAAGGSVVVPAVRGGAPRAPVPLPGYSPDPLFWGGTPTGNGGSAPPGADTEKDNVRDDVDDCPTVANPDQRDTNLDGIGDACEPPDQQHATAAFVQAGLDGRTGVAPTGTAVAQEPAQVDRLVQIVRFRLNARLTDSPPQLTHNLVQSLVGIGLVSPQNAAALEQAVLRQVNG